MRSTTTAMQKNIWKSSMLILLSFILILAISLPLFQARAESAAVTTDYLNLRTGPGTSNSIIMTIPKGQSITVHSTSNGWCYVTTASGRQGYVSADYVQITASAATVSAVSTGSSVRLRTGPGSGYPVLM